MTAIIGKRFALVALGFVALAGGVPADLPQEPAGTTAPPAAESKTAPAAPAEASRKGPDSPKTPTDWANPAPAAADAAKYQASQLEAALQVKLAELHRAEAGLELADALVKINERLNARIKGSVSAEEKAKTEAERKAKAAEVESAKAQMAWVQFQLDWVKRDPAAHGLIFTADQPWPPAKGPASLEARLAEIERKLARVLQLLEAPKRPEGLLGP